MFLSSRRALCILLVLFFGTSRAWADEPVKLRTLAGKTIEGDLVSLSDKEVVLRAKTGILATPLTDVLDLAFPAAPAPPADSRYGDLELTDGSILHCSQILVPRDQFEAKLLSGPSVHGPLKAVLSFLGEAEDPKVREEWRGFVAKKTNQDLLAVRDAQGKVNVLDGTFGNGDEKGTSIEFELAAGAKRQLSLTRIHALSFVRAPDRSAPAPTCKVFDTSHNVLVAARTSLSGENLDTTTASGATARLPLSQVARLDFSLGKLAYLSDLDPVKVVESLNVEGVNHYRRDKNLDDGPLRLVTRTEERTEPTTFSKGLALHAYTELTYDIGGQYKEFQAIFGVDPAVGGDSNVKITIEGDGHELLSTEVRRKDNPRPVTCNVAGVRLLRIVVSPLNLLDLGNHLNIVDAKVRK
jgi:hypothetical protein